MEVLKNLVRECFYLSLLVCMVRLILGESNLNRYIQFVVGILFLLVIFNPVARLMGAEALPSVLRMQDVKRAFTEQKSFEQVIRQYGSEPKQEAADLLVDGFRRCIQNEPYEIRHYEVNYDGDCLESMTLFLAMPGKAIAVEPTTEDAQAKACKKRLMQLFRPEFRLIVKK
ncbi:MAG: hypothetical protein E7277_00450 [Lachnospiraceae bacterium]|nr:hypothetical protein [Lachnospiraceae bacterium]